MTNFEVVYNAFKRKIEDDVYMQLDTRERKEYLFGFLQDALGMIQAENIKMEHDLTLIDEVLQCFIEDLNYGEIMGISYYMIVAWYEPRINSLEHTLLSWGSKDEKWQDTNKHFLNMEMIQEKYRKKARKYFSDYRVKNNSYVRGDNNG